MDKLNVVEPDLTPKKLSFAHPDVFKKDEERGYMVIDRDKSEYGICLQALGRPSVYYLGRANKYFKDADCTNIMTDTEVQALNLPIPIEIETKRRKIMEQAQRDGTYPTEADVINATMPQSMEPPEYVKQRIKQADPIDRMIARANRSALNPK